MLVQNKKIYIKLVKVEKSISTTERKKAMREKGGKEEGKGKEERERG